MRSRYCAQLRLNVPRHSTVTHVNAHAVPPRDEPREPGAVNILEEMERKMRRTILAAACFLGVAAAAGPASAIECEGNFQVQKSGNLIATPYCQDGYLAIVAREYGMRVNAQEIRYNPSEKERVCRLVGEDNRVRDTCDQYRQFVPRFRR
jgi:hypothetical protein